MSRLLLRRPPVAERDLVTDEVVVEIIQTNRERIRQLASLVTASNAILLPTCFAVILFVVKERSFGVPVGSPLLLFGAAALFLASSLASVLAAFPVQPKSVHLKVVLIDVLASRYEAERRIIIQALGLHAAATIAFAVGLAVFAQAALSAS